MKIIADTNIWYYLAQDPNLFEKVKDMPINPTFINIYELSKSDNILNKEDLAREAIRKLFAFKSKAIFEPPFVYLARLHKEFDFNPEKEVGGWLRFTKKFANGGQIDPNQRGRFKEEINGIRADLKSGAEFFNQEAERIKDNIKDKREHKKEDTLETTAGFLNFVIETATDQQCDLKSFDFNKIELLWYTLDYFFKTLEISQRKFQENDWFDFSILAYIQPDDKFWTREKRWINLIQEAGFEDYLFNP